MPDDTAADHTLLRVPLAMAPRVQALLAGEAAALPAELPRGVAEAIGRDGYPWSPLDAGPVTVRPSAHRAAAFWRECVRLLGEEGRGHGGARVDGEEANLLLFLLDGYIAALRRHHAAGARSPFSPAIPGYEDPGALEDLRDRLFRAHRHPGEDDDAG